MNIEKDEQENIKLSLKASPSDCRKLKELFQTDKDIDIKLGSVTTPKKKFLNKLSQWANDLVQPYWLSNDFVLPSCRFKKDLKSIQKAKIIDLESHLVLFIVEVISEEGQSEISLCIYPQKDHYLPEGLQLKILDEIGKKVYGDNNEPLEKIAGMSERWLELIVNGETGDLFKVKIALGDMGIVEEFEI